MHASTHQNSLPAEELSTSLEAGAELLRVAEKMRSKHHCTAEAIFWL